MKRTHLLSTAAVVIVLSAGMAFAQAPAPAAQQNAPAEKIAPVAPVKPAVPAQTQKSPSVAPTTNAADAKTDMKVPPAAAGKEEIKGPGETNRAVAPASGTTGTGAASASRLSSEQRSKISGVIRQQKVQPVTLNVSITVGTRVPRNVRYYPLPREVVIIYPEWRGYDYILVGSQILVLDPRTHEIVAILEA